MKLFLEVKDVTGQTYQQDLGNLTDEIVTSIEESIKTWKVAEGTNGIVQIPDVGGNTVCLNNDNVVYVKVIRVPTSEPVNPGFTA